MQGQMAVLANHWSAWLNAGSVPPRLGNSHATVVPYRDFRAADGDVIVAVGSDGQFQKLCRLLGRADLGADPELQTNAGRQRNRARLEAALAEAIAGWTLAELIPAMEREGVPGGPINRLDQLFADPQVAATGMVAEVARSDGTPVRLVPYPHRLSETPARVERAPPRLGEHTRTVLARDLGLGGAELDRLEAAGIIG
jgi:crotonobetainyl-CoA:carnitine CoA-transferase CaiB-like acyl-CoA transferase